MQVANIIAGSTLTAMTATGGFIGYAFQALAAAHTALETAHTASSSGYGFIAAGCAGGLACGAPIAGLLWSMYYNPLPQVFRDLTTKRYELEQKYGAGCGDYLVAKVRDRRSNERAVLKMPILGSYSDSRVDRSRYLTDQYRVLSALNSPHWVRPLELIKGFGYAILVMEHVDGPTLQERYSQNGPLDFLQTLEVALAVAKGLEELNKKGYSFDHQLDCGCNIVLHPERKAVLIDPQIRSTEDPRHDMNMVATVIAYAGGFWEHPDQPVETILRGRGCADEALLAKAARLQTIMDRINEKPGFKIYEGYDELIHDLEVLLD